MKILISAAETSSDAHGAELLKAIRSQLGGKASLEVFGIGGPKLQSAGLRVVLDARELLVMGFTEILGKLPRIFRALNQVTDEARKQKPDLAIVIDYPDFHFKLARRLKGLGIPVVYYIPPKVWVWRKNRIQLLREMFVKVLCIFPFEEKFFSREKVRAKYVGNPLLDELPLDLTREQARKRLAIDPQSKVLVLMPGSRVSELKRHLELMLDAAVHAAAKLRAKGFLGIKEPLEVLIPFAGTANFSDLIERVNRWLEAAGGGTSDFILKVRASQENAAEALVAADAGLIKSGTSTLEAALLGCPLAVVYKTTLMTQWIFRYLIRYPGPVGLVNLVNENRDRLIANEILLDQVTVENLSTEIVSLLTDEKKRSQMKYDLNRLRGSMVSRQSPSVTAAQEILSLLNAGEPR